MLGTAATGLLIVHSGLVPAKISALGIEFSKADQKVLLQALGMIVSYFLIAFILYAAADYLAWRAAYVGAMRDIFPLVNKDPDPELDDFLRRRVSGDQKLLGYTKPVSRVRAAFEFVFPIVVGIVAVVTLFRASPPIAR